MLFICVVWQWCRCGQTKGDRNPNVDPTFDPSSCSFAQLTSWHTAEEQKLTRSLPISHRDAQTVKSLQCYCEATKQEVDPFSFPLVPPSGTTRKEKPDSPDPDPIRHPWDMPEQVWTLEVPHGWSWFWPIKVRTYVLWGGAKDLRC